MNIAGHVVLSRLSVRGNGLSQRFTLAVAPSTAACHFGQTISLYLLCPIRCRDSEA